jgi:hypothetical protein
MKRSKAKKPLNGSNASPPPKGSYRIGPGHPPREYQFKPGQSGNPRGARRKASSIAPDLKAALERALQRKVTITQGEIERTIDMATAGIERLINQFAKGDWHARRDLIALAGKLGVDLTAAQTEAIEHAMDEVLATDRQFILDRYVARRTGQKDLSAPSPKIAPPELLDDLASEDLDDRRRK